MNQIRIQTVLDTVQAFTDWMRNMQLLMIIQGEFSDCPDVLIE